MEEQYMQHFFLSTSQFIRMTLNVLNNDVIGISSTIKTHKAVARHIGDQIQITTSCCHCKPGRRKKCQI